MNKYLIVFFYIILQSALSQAYITGSYQTSLMPEVRTRVLIVGKGTDLGTQFQVAASAKAKKYRELYPTEQIFLISVDEFEDWETDKITQSNIDFLHSLNFTDLQDKGSGLKTKHVLKELRYFKKIASIDIFSHSTAYYGVILDGPFNRMDPKKDGYDILKNNFTEDAYAFLHGCNSGQYLAPVFSAQWGIPVAGSLTSTMFYRLASDGNFYANYPNTLPEGISWAQQNKSSYQNQYGCRGGACLVLKSDNVTYTGHWGEFSGGGLGFFKFYCMKNTQEHCFKTMALAALSYLSDRSLTLESSYEDYKSVIVDWLCPISAKRPDRREACRQGLQKVADGILQTYDSFDGKSLECDFKGCKAKFSCKRVPVIDLLQAGSCKVENLRPSNKTTTQAEEFKAYLKGWELLQKNRSFTVEGIY